jgi:hypothetical protein
MVHLRGLSPTSKQIAKLGIAAREPLTPAEKQENGLMDAHAALDETGRMLFLNRRLLSEERGIE